MECVSIIVRGKVQGVAFRFYTQARAKDLNIKGWVKNLPSGEVEIKAYSENASALADFIDFCRSGPPHARVEDIDLMRSKGEPTTNDFHIRS